jgi:hypothetical protein
MGLLKRQLLHQQAADEVAAAGFAGVNFDLGSFNILSL